MLIRYCMKGILCCLCFPNNANNEVSRYFPFNAYITGTQWTKRNQNIGTINDIFEREHVKLMTQ